MNLIDQGILEVTVRLVKPLYGFQIKIWNEEKLYKESSEIPTIILVHLLMTQERTGKPGKI